ncbi:diacylglycerol kinase family protein [Paenibacillus camelliae]|uniref:diacylglycerol kinase family protein n=1 Tax=Paenibacillus camelliae TaxID=512410 RepID=UPI00203ABCE9|nr:diacylglycerol kinase family protein [Paenibacillus camelliae]MCM3633232.1 diacylglycerol kinase family protein [Paenibacillus camelliae]
MKKLLKSFGYAFAGIWSGFRTQRNIKIHVAVALLVFILGAIVSLTRMEWMIVIIVICAVISLELINTAIEAAVDMHGTKRHPLAKLAKDTAAGAVLVMSIGAVLIGLLIFLPKLYSLL